MTLLTVWLAPDCWDEHFLFYNLSQNINSLKDILQILWTLLGPLFKGPAPSAWYQKKGPVILYSSCSTTVQKILTVLEISVHLSLIHIWALPTLCRVEISWVADTVKNLILNNFCSIMLCKIFVVFEILEVKYLQFWLL